jgi:two-component sensor histidine kinase
MVRIVCYILLYLIAALPNNSFAQNKQIDISHQRLLLNMTWGFLYVVKQNQVDRDSSLTQSCRQLKIDRLVLITQNDESPFCEENNFVSGKEELKFLKKQLRKYVDNENTRLLNSIGWMYTFEQGNLQNNLDSARLFLNQAKAKALALQDHRGLDENLCYSGLYYYKKGELKSGDSCLEKAITECKNNGDKVVEALALTYKGTYYPFGQCPFSVRIDCLKKASVLYQQLNDKESQALSLLNTAYFLFANNELPECKEQASGSLQLQKEIKFPDTYFTTDLLALVSVVDGNHADYLKYALESIRAIETTNDSVGIAYFYARAGDAYGEVSNKMEESVNWYLKAINEFQKNGGDPMMYKVLISFGTEMEALGRSKEMIALGEKFMKKYPPVNAMDRQNLFMVLGEAYLKIGETEMSGKYYKAAEKLEPAVQAVSGNVNTGSIYYYLGLYYFKIKHYEKSRTYFMKILNDKLPTGVEMVSFSKIHLILFSIDSAAGHLNNAIKHLKEYIRLNDSTYNEQQSKQVQEWDIVYNTEKKEKDLQLLTKENQVKELSLKKADFTRNVIVVSAVLILLLLFIGYSLKQRHNQKLQLQQIEINDQNKLLKDLLTEQQKLLEEKEWLVKEIHHRVKNNLQMIISLLNAQSEFLDHPSALNAIKESRDRMQAVALIHQKLYQPDQGTSINMLAYIKEMVNCLGSSFADVERINFKLDVEDINLDVSQAVPLGLILNEAITNAIKYAFPVQSGTIDILLSYQDTTNIILKIKDNGKGFPENFDFKNNNSLGIQLIHLFAEQLEGDLKFKSTDGVEITLVFKQFHPDNKNNSLINIG